MFYKVLVTTSGTGSRLGEITKDKNKVLVDINNKAAITHIIDAYPKEVPFVITLGYLGDQVKEFIEKTYLDRQFEFAIVDKFEGPGSSLGYSLLQAKEYLQCPFIFQACDTIVVENIPEPDKNWIAGFMVDKENTDLPLSQYRTHKIENGKIIRLNDKGIMDFESIHIGLDGIFDYEKFWQTLDNIYQSDPENTGLSEVHVLEKMLQDGVDFSLVPYNTWLDTGNLESLEKTREFLRKN